MRGKNPKIVQKIINGRKHFCLTVVFIRIDLHFVFLGLIMFVNFKQKREATTAVWAIN